MKVKALSAEGGRHGQRHGTKSEPTGLGIGDELRLIIKLVLDGLDAQEWTGKSIIALKFPAEKRLLHV
jgi:hypothetical protein